ncbi:IS701 family transposase [Streptomyces sp. NPDC048248]|uniref:IS701 family transposase n=1 Tax=Streptomyces sp. NPDC048248 TaxID=3365523 RepID=UPI00371C343E
MGARAGILARADVTPQDVAFDNAVTDQAVTDRAVTDRADHTMPGGAWAERDAYATYDGDVFGRRRAERAAEALDACPEPGRAPDELIAELGGLMFASLARSDQRRKGEQYLRGLLAAEGRKSIRNIASFVGDRAAEQSLHHFISSSTWHWRPMREALARYVDRVLRPEAWVVRPIVIPKAGHHSVGVERRYIPWLGQVVNGQQALGAWGATKDASIPVDWQLLLSDDEAGAAGGRLTGTPVECAAATVTGLGSGSGIRPRPVVLDLPDADLPEAVRRFGGSGMPLVAVASGTTLLTSADPVLPGLGDREFSAQRLLHMVRTLRRPVDWHDPLEGTVRRSDVAAVQVRLAGAPRSRPLLLVGEWDSPRGWPRTCWLTDLRGVSPARLLRLGKLALRVDRDVAEVSPQVGLMDFEGRSYEGWHRHTTLASAAHAVRILGGGADRALRAG